MKHYKQETELLAEKIVNTRDTTRAEPEYLRTPADLARYLKIWQISPTQMPTEADLAEVLAFRSRLRSVFEARTMTSAVKILNELLDGVRVQPHIKHTSDGSIKMEFSPVEDLPLAGRLAVEAVLGLSTALEQYGIERLHVCQAAPCTDVFIDTSRNHTRRYCCEQCANRHNVAAYRQRQKTT